MKRSQSTLCPDTASFERVWGDTIDSVQYHAMHEGLNRSLVNHDRGHVLKVLFTGSGVYLGAIEFVRNVQLFDKASRLFVVKHQKN